MQTYIILLSAIALTSSSCGVVEYIGQEVRSSRDHLFQVSGIKKSAGSIDKEERSAGVLQEDLKERYGEFYGLVEGNSDSVQTMTLHRAGLAINSVVEFPEHALEKDVTLSVSEGQATDTQLLQERLDINSEIIPLGVPVMLKLSDGRSLQKEAKISLPITEVMADEIAMKQAEFSVAVLYKSLNNAGDIVEGLLNTPSLDLSDSEYISFKTNKLGSFQVVLIQRNLYLYGLAASSAMETVSRENMSPALGRRSPMAIKRVNASMASDGDVVSVEGFNFRDVKVFIRGKAISKVVVKSDKQLFFQMPSRLVVGSTRIWFQQDGVTAFVWLLVKNSDTKVVMASKASDVCSTESFVSMDDSSAKIVQGTRNCDQAKICTTENETGCLTTAAVPAVPAADLLAYKNGASNNNGNTSPVCTADGQTSCIASAQYPAANISSLSASDVKAGKTIAGIIGTIGSCSQDGELNCVTNAVFPALNTVGAASKILLGQSLATVSGTFLPDFPDRSKVLNTDTVNNLAGTLTLPNASNVKVSNGSYGINGNSHSPGLNICANDGETDCVASSNFPAVDRVHKLLSANIRQGVSIASVSGSVVAKPSDCQADGETACVTTAQYKAADAIAITASNIKQGISIAGVTGTYGGGAIADCSQDGEIGCKTVNAFRSVVMTNVLPANIKQGVSIAGISGNLISETHLACASDGEEDCISNASYRAAATTSLAAKVLLGQTVAGVQGQISAEEHSACNADGALGCVTNAQYRAASVANIVPADIRSGVSLAGITGTAQIENHLACIMDGGTNCVVDGTNYVAAAKAMAIPANIKSGVSIAGVQGNVQVKPSDCSSDGATGCVTTASYKSAAVANITAADLRTGLSIAGITGTATIETHIACVLDGATDCVVDGTNFVAASKALAVPGNIKTGITLAGATGNVQVKPADCSADGATGCVTTTNYKSAAVSNILPTDVRTGVTLAGVVGTATIETHAACSADGAGSCIVDGTTYVAAIKALAIPANIKTGITLAGAAGSVQAKPADCSADGGSSCVVDGTSYVAASMALAIPGNIKTGITLAGAAGNVQVKPADCSTDGATACVTTSNYKSAAVANITSADLKSGLTIAGIQGSATIESHSTCSADGSVGCVTTIRYKSADTSNFSSTDFRSNKTIAGIAGGINDCATDGEQSCYVNASSTFKAGNTNGLNSTVIKKGYQLAGITGSKTDMKNCRNLANINVWDNTVSPGAAGLDAYDTIDDYNDNQLEAFLTSVWGSNGYSCGSSNFTYSTGTQVYATDSLTGLSVAPANAPGGGNKGWASAVGACKSLVWDNIGPNVWRLPTQKELMQLYIDGISKVDQSKMGTMNQVFWTSTTASDAGLYAWAVNPAIGGAINLNLKLSALAVMCVK